MPEPRRRRPGGFRFFVGIVIACVGAAVLYGLYLSGSPYRQRLRLIDTRRVDELEQIANVIDRFWHEHERLPRELEELRRTRGASVNSVADPQTGAPYEYRITGEHRYELCALFDTDSSEERPAAPRWTPRGRPEGFWTHPPGRACFEVEADTSDPDED